MCFKERQTPASCVGCFSFLTLAGAIATGYFAVLFANENYKSADPARVNEETTSSSVTISVPEADAEAIFGVFFNDVSTGSSNLQFQIMTNMVKLATILALFIAICGFCACAKTNRCCSVTTGLCSTPLAFIFIFVGLTFLNLVGEYETGLAEIDAIKCANVDEYMQLQFQCDAGIEKSRTKCRKNESDLSKVDPYYKFGGQIDIDQTLGPLINTYMCSARCRCKPVASSSDWTEQSSKDLVSKYGRNPSKIPFKFDSQDQGYTNFRQCLEANFNTKSKDSFSSFARSMAKLDTYQTAADFLEKVEAEGNCYYGCVPRLFFFARDTFRGIPSERCSQEFDFFTENYTNFKLLAFATCLTAFTLSCLCCCQYCLWKKYETEDENDMKVTTTRVEKFEEL